MEENQDSNRVKQPPDNESSELLEALKDLQPVKKRYLYFFHFNDIN